MVQLNLDTERSDIWIDTDDCQGIDFLFIGSIYTKTIDHKLVIFVDVSIFSIVKFHLKSFFMIVLFLSFEWLDLLFVDMVNVDNNCGQQALNVKRSCYNSIDENENNAH